MIFIIDTSSVPSVIATISSPNRWDEMGFNPRETPIATQFPYMVKDASKLTKVAVATGPGSFTGLRAGVAFGLGLAIGLRIPIVPLPSLGLQAARSERPATAVIDAGRGRYYFQVPGEQPRLGAPAEIPATHHLVGSVADRARLIAAGHRFLPDGELRSFADAAAKLLETACEVPYRKLEIRYMQSFSAKGQTWSR